MTTTTKPDSCLQAKRQTLLKLREQRISAQLKMFEAFMTRSNVENASNDYSSKLAEVQKMEKLISDQNRQVHRNKIEQKENEN